MKKWTVATFQAAKGREKLGCCTAYYARAAFAQYVAEVASGTFPPADKP